MSKDYIEEILAEASEGLSRRDAMKLAGVSSAAFMVGGAMTEAEAATALSASGVTGKIVIVGGGLAGMSTASRLTNNISNPDITVIEPDPLSVSYQPGQTLVAAGLWDQSDIEYLRDDFVPSGVKLIKNFVTEFDPTNNTVTTDAGEKISYDYLVVATGLVLNYSKIKGLDGTGIMSSSSNNESVKKKVGHDGVYSIYFADGASDTWKGIQALIAQAKAHKGPEKLQALFTHPNTPIKCGGAPKKIMSLTHARLEEAGVRDKVELTFLPNGGGMFGIKDYHTAIVAQFKARGFKWHYKHNLVAIDTAAKVATFDKRWEEKGAYDEDTEEFTMVTKHENVDFKYDFIHITPPMSAPEVIAKSALATPKGWVAVKKESLQSLKYNNVFTLGDVASLPMGKTGGSVRKEYKVLVTNLVETMEGKPMTAKFDGYTVCPLITGIGTVMMAEFNWASKAAGSGENAKSAPLDPTKERWLWWFVKTKMLKPMTIYGMIKMGRA
ncbi:MAG: NAD(P)/FAD-dependent oxidoreductase [Helicobacteraceae bacterium]|nr:NAD(P)/FAD-dependent oxidoreductase [Helicobacteraceae bacterium]